MINPRIAGDTRPQGKLSLDAATRRHRGIFGEQNLAYLGFLVGPACPAQQGAVFSSTAKFLRRYEATLPEPSAVCPGIGFIRSELASCGGFGIQGKALADKELVQAGGFTLDRANAGMPPFVGGIRTEFLATDLVAPDQAGEMVARVNTACPWVGVVVDANLVKRRCVDAVEPIGYIGEVDGRAVPDDRAGGEALTG
ncbi:hypothetical protein GALL_516770 [mine drainage metagenome]|uniref:Uncharacterized protein n=1 Tax=mine drainage metagenome TaxID=410659 RepID=A0A1J5P7M4_9ZZZZ